MRITRAMLFAAGLGTRMRPLTDRTPKPLIRVGEKPLLDHTLERFLAFGIERVMVNTHYLAPQIEAHVRGSPSCAQLELSHEDPLLETGGGIVKVLSFFQDRAFFSANWDTIWLDGKTPALERMAEAFDPKRMDALLLLHPLGRAVGYHGPGNFDLGPDGTLIKNPHAPYVFTGLQILHPRLFEGRSAAPFSLRELYQAADDGSGKLSRMFGLVHEGEFLHVGSPEELAQANAFFAALKA